MSKTGKTDKQLRRLCVNHWKRILNLSITDIKNDKEVPNDKNCAFCLEYNVDRFPACTGCPIYKKTKQKYCNGTPYKEAVFLYSTISADWIVTDSNGNISNVYNEFKAAVKNEIEFLENLDL